MTQTHLMWLPDKFIMVAKIMTKIGWFSTTIHQEKDIVLLV